jgi:hypothetical protein
MKHGRDNKVREKKKYCYYGKLGHMEKNCDAGALLHLNTCQLINTHGAHSRKEMGHPLIFALKIQDVI